MKKIAITISVLVNVFVLIVAIWLVSGGGIKLLIENFVRPAHERWVSQFAELDIKLGDVVFLGDSITAGGAWQEIFPNADVRNRGIGGDDTRGVLARIDQVSSGRPAQVFLLIGTNDLGIGVAEADIVANIRKILDEIHSLSPQTQIYVQSIMPRSIEFRARIESLNQAIQPAIEGEAVWVDLYPIFLASDGSIKDEYSNDELHLHGVGYMAWRDAIQDLVASE